MTPQRYRISSPTIAMYQKNGKHICVKIPADAVVTVDSETFDVYKLVKVFWAEKSLMMFTQDIRTRGEKV